MAEVARMTHEEIVVLAGRVVRGEVWLGSDLWSLQGFEAYVMLFGSALPDRIGALWEFMSHAGAHSVNGCPTFLSISGMVHVEDGPELLREIRAMLRATGVEVPSEEELERIAAQAQRVVADE